MPAVIGCAAIGKPSACVAGTAILCSGGFCGGQQHAQLPLNTVPSHQKLLNTPKTTEKLLTEDSSRHE
jgi:hypothetical protein